MRRTDRGLRFSAAGPNLWAPVVAAIFACQGSIWADQPAGTNAPADLTDLSLEQLTTLKVDSVYSASKHEQKVTEAPSSVSIVTADEIKEYGHRTLADILRSVRGFYVTYDRNYGYIGVRGFNRPGDFGGRVLILVDGQQINEPLFDSAFNLTDFILDVDLIQRVEVIRGPGSALYGNNAFFAVVNVITRTGQQMDGAEVSGSAASFDTYSGRASFGKKFKNDVELLFSGTVYNSEGPDRLYFKEFDTPDQNHGIAQNMDADQFHSFLGRLSYHDFSLESAYVSRDKQVPTASFDTAFNDPRYHTIDTRYFANLQFAHEFPEDLQVKAKVYYDYYNLAADYPYAGAPLNRDADYAEWFGADAQVSKVLFEKHLVTLGTEFRDDYRLDLLNYDVGPGGTVYLDSHRSDTRYAVFGQEEFQILPSLLLNAGVRYDYFSTFGDTVNPRAALMYSPWEKTTFKAVYGQAFRAPNADELYYTSSVEKANPNLRPETIHSYELIYEQYLPANLRMSASAFYDHIQDLISESTDPRDGMIFFDNVEQAESKGLEWELEGRYASGWAGRLSYTLQRTTDAHTDEELSNSPRHLVKFNLTTPLYKDKLFSGLEVQYTSPVKTLARQEAEGFCLVNWTLFSQKLVKGLEVSVSIYNLFDTRYAFAAAEENQEDLIPQDGRTFRVKLTYHF